MRIETQRERGTEPRERGGQRLRKRREERPRERGRQRLREGALNSRALVKLWQPAGPLLHSISLISLLHLLSSHTGNFCDFPLQPPLNLHKIGLLTKHLLQVVLHSNLMNSLPAQEDNATSIPFNGDPSMAPIPTHYNVAYWLCQGHG